MISDTSVILSKLRLTLSMMIFGSIGIFIRYIPLSTSVIAALRGLIGTVFLIVAVSLGGKRISFEAIKQNLLLLILSGLAVGINWIFIFEAYRRIPIAAATAFLYLAPVFVTLLSPVILKEKLSPLKVVCAVFALLGMFVISVGGKDGELNAPGIICALCAAVLYAAFVLLNKLIKGISSYDMAIVQLFTAFLALLPYALKTSDLSSYSLCSTDIILLITVGIVHTGLTYWLYFGSLKKLSAQTAALLSYVDPLSAIVLSAVILKETMNPVTAAGIFLIFGSTIAGEVPQTISELRKRAIKS